MINDSADTNGSYGIYHSRSLREVGIGRHSIVESLTVNPRTQSIEMELIVAKSRLRADNTNRISNHGQSHSRCMEDHVQTGWELQNRVRLVFPSCLVDEVRTRESALDRIDRFRHLCWEGSDSEMNRRDWNRCEDSRGWELWLVAVEAGCSYFHDHAHRLVYALGATFRMEGLHSSPLPVVG